MKGCNWTTVQEDLDRTGRVDWQEPVRFSNDKSKKVHKDDQSTWKPVGGKPEKTAFSFEKEGSGETFSALFCYLRGGYKEDGDILLVGSHMEKMKGSVQVTPGDTQEWNFSQWEQSAAGIIFPGK